MEIFYRQKLSAESTSTNGSNDEKPLIRIYQSRGDLHSEDNTDLASATVNLEKTFEIRHIRQWDVNCFRAKSLEDAKECKVKKAYY